MKRVLLLFIMIVALVSISGCSASSSSSQQSSSSSGLSKQEVIEIDEYVHSQEVVALHDCISDSIDGLADLVAAGDSLELHSRFLDLAIAINDVEKIDVPDICSGLHDTLLQEARCLSLALSNLANVAELGLGASSDEYEEASRFLKLANQYADEYNDEFNRLAEMM